MTPPTFRVCGSNPTVKEPTLQYPPIDVPWGFVAPHEAGAMRNHGQDFATLHRRGGVTPTELLAILDCRGHLPLYDAATMRRQERAGHDELQRRLQAWRERQP
jgi:hypothetical protein